MAALIGKGRKPKFDLYLRIYDLNNVPLVSGSSFVKWHIDMHAEHRGRTSKCLISNHRVDYSYNKHIPHVRISVDRTNNLTECPLELEIIQEFGFAETIKLGRIKLNLSEFVEDSDRGPNSPPRKRSSGVGPSPTDASRTSTNDPDFETGVIRRYLMQDSKVNSTLKIGILMVQTDGDRNFIAPTLKAAPVFGGITGLMAAELPDDEAGHLPSISKPRDASDVHDLYRRTLVASWSAMPGELPADECIEDIFSGGNGWRTSDASSSPDSDDDDFANSGTLRPSDIRRLTQRHQHHHHHHHRRTHSGSSDKSVSTVTGKAGSGGSSSGGHRAAHRHQQHHHPERSSSPSGSLASLAPTLDSDPGGRLGDVQRHREVQEEEMKGDMVAWHLPGGLAA